MSAFMSLLSIFFSFTAFLLCRRSTISSFFPSLSPASPRVRSPSPSPDHIRNGCIAVQSSMSVSHFFFFSFLFDLHDYRGAVLGRQTTRSLLNPSPLIPKSLLFCSEDALLPIEPAPVPTFLPECDLFPLTTFFVSSGPSKLPRLPPSSPGRFLFMRLDSLFSSFCRSSQAFFSYTSGLLGALLSSSALHARWIEGPPPRIIRRQLDLTLFSRILPLHFEPSGWPVWFQLMTLL